MPTLTDFTFQLTDTGVLLNGDVSKPFVDITKVVGLDSAPYRESSRDHEGTDGGFLDAEFEKGRPITLEGTAYGDVAALEAYLDTIKDNFAPSKTALPFYFQAPGVNQRVVYVKPRGVNYDWTTARRYGCVDIKFNMFAEDPRIYDSATFSIDIPQGATITTGRSFPAGFPLGFGAAATGTDGQTITVGGKRPVPAILTITGPVTGPQIINETAGLILKFNTILNAGETLVIDLANKTVMLNGISNRRGSLEAPNWFMFEPGDTFIRYHAEVAGTSTLNISGHQAAWR